MGMILSAFAAALGQWSDPRFRRVVLLGVALTLGLLVALYAVIVTAIQWMVPETTDLPLIGPVGGLDTLLSVGSVLVMLLASVVLMVPVASAFSGLFLDSVAEAVERRHYPALPMARPQGLAEGMVAAVGFFGIVLGANLVALLLWPLAGPFVPLVFWGVNGYLLAREYATLVAMRRMDRAGAKALWRAHKGRLWLAGVLMAAPLSVPVVNLLIPVFGVATFTHLVHRLTAR